MIEVKELNFETRVGLATDAEEPRCKDLKAKDGNVIVALDIIVPSGSIKSETLCPAFVLGEDIILQQIVAGIAKCVIGKIRGLCKKLEEEAEKKEVKPDGGTHASEEDKGTEAFA